MYIFRSIWWYANYFLSPTDSIDRPESEIYLNYLPLLIKLLDLIDEGKAIDERKNGERGFFLTDCEYLKIQQTSNKLIHEFDDILYILSLVKLLQFRDNILALRSTNKRVDSDLDSIHVIAIEKSKIIQAMEVFLDAQQASDYAFTQITDATVKREGEINARINVNKEVSKNTRRSPLVKLIGKFLDINPNASAKKVEQHLRASEGFGTVVEIVFEEDQESGEPIEKIYFDNPDKPGPLKSVNMSGLKGIVSRIKNPKSK